MILLIDFGNTSIKIGTPDNQKVILIKRFSSKNLNKEVFFSIIKSNQPSQICYLNVTPVDHDILFFFKELDIPVVNFTHSFALPFEINYSPKESLGLDRLAGVIGARSIFPNSNFLVIQAGTCITYDFFINNIYLGGAISPGLGLRARELGVNTSQLPVIDIDSSIKETNIIGTTTFESISSGVLNGLLFEMQGFIEYLIQDHNEIKILLSGGDILYFAEKIKSKIFAIPNITLIGLNEILKLNE